MQYSLVREGSGNLPEILFGLVATQCSMGEICARLGYVLSRSSERRIHRPYHGIPCHRHRQIAAALGQTIRKSFMDRGENPLPSSASGKAAGSPLAPSSSSGTRRSLFPPLWGRLKSQLEDPSALPQQTGANVTLDDLAKLCVSDEHSPSQDRKLASRTCFSLIPFLMLHSLTQHRAPRSRQPGLRT